MKRLFALALAALMLLGSCGAPTEATDAPEVTEAPVTDAPVVTEAPETEAQETEPVVQKDDFTIEVKEDTYVYKATGNANMDDNFGSEADLQLKGTSSAPNRFTYLKFDVSALEGDTDFTAIDLKLMLKMKQNNVGDPEQAVIEVYGVGADTWDENTLTYNNQPAHFELICARDDVSTTGSVYEFPVGSYVKYALSRGETEVAFFIKDSTSSPLHIKFESRESEKQGPELAVYYGTKIEQALNESSESGYSKSGIDNIFGLHAGDSKKFEVIEDTFIQAGTTADTNFGDATSLDFKAYAGKENNYYRITLLKFDLDEIRAYEEKVGTTYPLVEIELGCSSIESVDHPTRINVYDCFAADWLENEVTYNTRPEREDFISTTVVSGTGNVRIDVSDHVRRYINAGYKEISFYLEGDEDSIRRLNFYSKESEIGGATLVLGQKSNTFATDIKFIGENPWDVAAERVSTWLNRWEKIKNGGDRNVEQIAKIDAEYSVTVGATKASGTNGASTKYTSYPTRLISTLQGYTASTAETAKYDIYGGLMDESMKQEATGFFYTKKIGDRWWTIDPLGYPFFRTAVVTISVGSTNQKAAKLAIYGDTATWAKETTARLRELGFNSAGGWSATDNLIKVEQPLAQTNIMYVLKKYCESNGIDVSESGSTTLMFDVMPVFDPAFETAANTTVASAVKNYKTSSLIYGWMSDNELPQSLRMLDSALTLNTVDSRFIYTYATAWTFMYLKTGKMDVSVSDVTDELRKEYRAMVYDRYFEVVSNALDRYAPYQQYMGCRFLAGCYENEEVMRVAGYWCDVISYNYYGAWDADFELVANQVEWAGRPFIVTEWYAKGMDVWEKDNRMTNESGAGWTVKDQDDRGRFYQNFALSLMECGGCVGFDWFMYNDNDPDNLSADLSNRNSNKGIIANDGTEYTELTKYMGELNNQKYNIISFFDAR